ncbi:hypothetical protein B0H12DRAFT_153231 [Mycena haematopus]|nr:hypothetical protein B0H12DRAFT_153231 [Mycena haematopus]
MDAVSSSQWVLPPGLPQAWLAALQPSTSTIPTVSQLPTSRQQLEDEEEPTPPIPSNLLGRDCLYGFTISAEIQETYDSRGFPNPYTDLDVRRQENTDSAVYSVARQLGMTVAISYPDGRDVIVWFTFSRGGRIRGKQIPTASRLERFAKELGITEKPQWHDAWPDAQE